MRLVFLQLLQLLDRMTIWQLQMAQNFWFGSLRSKGPQGTLMVVITQVVLWLKYWSRRWTDATSKQSLVIRIWKDFWWYDFCAWKQEQDYPKHKRDGYTENFWWLWYWWQRLLGVRLNSLGLSLITHHWNLQWCITKKRFQVKASECSM